MKGSVPCLDPKQGVWECLWTTFVNGGQITVQGPFYDTRNTHRCRSLAEPGPSATHAAR